MCLKELGNIFLTTVTELATLIPSSEVLRTLIHDMFRKPPRGGLNTRDDPNDSDDAPERGHDW